MITASKKPTAYLIAGVNGSGKTTSIAKLAQRLKEQGNSIVLAACDTFRAAAADQLAIWAELLGADIVRGAPGADPASVAHDACDRAWRGADILIVDTAGRLHTQSHLMRELEKIRNVVQRKIPGRRTRFCSSSTRPTAKTPSVRPRCSPNPSAAPA